MLSEEFIKMFVFFLRWNVDKNILAHCFQKRVLCCSYTLFCGNHSCTIPLNRAPKTRSCLLLRDGNQKWQPSTFLASVSMCAWVKQLGGYTETTERSPKLGSSQWLTPFSQLSPSSAGPLRLCQPIQSIWYWYLGYC